MENKTKWRNDMKKEYIFAGIAIGCWGTVATVSKLLMNQLDAMYALAFSFLFATIFLFIYNWKSGHLKLLKQIPKAVAVRMILVGSLGVLLYNLFLLLGTDRLPAQEAFVINDLWPALIIIFSCIILHEKMTLGKAAAILFSFLGIVVVTTDGDLRNFEFNRIDGIIYCLMAAVCYGLYSTLNKRESYDKNISVLLSYASGTVIAFLWIIATGNLSIPTPDALGGMAFNGIICNGLPYLFWAFALDMGNTAIIANLAYLSPFVSLLVTHFVLGEKITVYSVLGLMLIILGIVIQMVTQRFQTPTEMVNQ